jgi:plasminogen activator inhibitor 1 RNA-binding protein
LWSDLRGRWVAAFCCFWRCTKNPTIKMNFFSVLDDSDNEEDKKVVPVKKGTAAPAAAPAKKDAAPAKKDAAPKKDAPKSAKAVEEKPKSKGKHHKYKQIYFDCCVQHFFLTNECFCNVDAAPKSKDAKVAQSTGNDAEKETGKDDNRGGHRNRERHGEKHGRGGAERAAGADGERRAPRREFDRRSGTGRGREVSRGGRGAFGAGNPAQDALDAEKNPQAAIEGAVEGAVEEEVVVEDVTPAEPEPVTFTLDDYLQKREEARERLAALTGAPAPIRTVDKEKEFAGLAAVATPELDNYVGSSATKAEAGRKDQRSTGKAVVLNVGFKFPTVQPEREDRGPRTGGRVGDREGGRGGRREGGAGRGGRGEGRGDRSERPASGRGAPRAGAAAFNAEKDFPKL